MSDDLDSSRTTVKTYVPAYQRNEWARQAEELDMSLSEFVRTMVQAGRQGFEGMREETSVEGSNPGGNTVESTILETLHDEPATFEDLNSRFEDVIAKHLEALQEQGAIEQKLNGSFRRAQ